MVKEVVQGLGAEEMFGLPMFVNAGNEEGRKKKKMMGKFEMSFKLVYLFFIMFTALSTFILFFVLSHSSETVWMVRELHESYAVQITEEFLTTSSSSLVSSLEKTFQNWRRNTHFRNVLY
eukprot:TRINITY_DN22945_c0_g1_i1.p1 TRINITY_DN22945_c0_g1~~TRINITY_DN22945_c0_g1_i1.p1  ORF type:complete len:120 (+),score=20.62 TRINITY_DN22945_c0_g1_i1:140-499(+)